MESQQVQTEFIFVDARMYLLIYFELIYFHLHIRV